MCKRQNRQSCFEIWIILICSLRFLVRLDQRSCFFGERINSNKVFKIGIYFSTQKKIQNSGLKWDGEWRQESGGTCAEQVGEGTFFKTIDKISSMEECGQKCLDDEKCSNASPRPRMWYNKDLSRCDIYQTEVKATGTCKGGAVFGYYTNGNCSHSLVLSF